MGFSTLLRSAGIAVVLAVAVTGAAGGQVTAPAPLEARAYDRLETLASAGLIRTLVEGQRPYSRHEVARLVAEARAALNASTAGAYRRAEAATLERLIAEMERKYPFDIAPGGSPVPPGAARLDGASAEMLYLDSPGRAIDDVGLGGIAASVNPLIENRGGRTYGARSSVVAELAGAAELSRHFAVNAHLRAGAGIGGGDDAPAGIGEVRALSATVGAHNILLQVGRQPLVYGQGLAGGPFSTRNSPGLDMIRLGNDVPARLPWIFSRLGPARGSIFVADLGADQHFPHTKLAGWKVSFLPSPRFEFGASLLSQQGGRGAPGAEWHERVVDLLTIVDVLFMQDRDLLFSNKLAGIDLRWRSRPVELYLDGMLDDFDVRRLGSSLWEDAGYVAGVVLPRLGHDGASRLDVEYQHTGLRYYEHGQFRSGVTSSRQIIGLPLGPRGDALVGRVRHDAGRRNIGWLTGAIERRSGDQYTVATSGAGDAGWQFVKTEDRPEEVRARLVAGWSRVGTRNARIELEGGIERVLDHAFVEGAAQTNALLRAAIVFGFD